MLIQQVIILRYIPVVEIGDSKIQQNIKQEGEVQNYEIEAVITYANHTLYGKIDPKNPHGFNEKIQEEE